MRKTLTAVLLASLVACGVSETEAKATLEGLESIATTSDDVRFMLLLNLCAEQKSCVGDCKEVLEAIGGVDPSDRITLLQQCDPNLKAHGPDTNNQQIRAWVNGRVGAYVKKVREALPEADRARLDKAWAQSTLQPGT